MKKFFFCAAAAIVALASCSKTQVVYNDAPEEIGFKAVSGVMTKAALGDQGHTTMGVFANYTEDKEVYFDDAQFTEGTEWVGSPAQYWPLTGSLDFAFYAPYNATAASRTYTASPAANTLSIIVDNSTTQVDWLYGAAMTTGTKTTPIANVSPTMKHLLAKIEINVTGSANVTVNEITLTGTEQKETATINYASAGALTWTNTNDPVDWKFLASTNPATAAFNLDPSTPKTFTCYVIPSAQTSFVLDYEISSVEAPDHEHTLTTLDNWVAGKKYVYNISVNPGEIKFTPAVTDWDSDLNEDTIENDDIPVNIN